MRTFEKLLLGALLLLFTNLLLAESVGTWNWLLMLQALIWSICGGWLVLCWSLRVAAASSSSRPIWRGSCAIAAALALLLALFWRGPPTENLLGIQDEAYNLATALSLQRTGEPTAIAPAERPAGVLMGERPTQAQRAKHPDDLGGMRTAYGYLFFDGEGALRSVFPVGFPIIAAGFGALFGATAIFWTNSFFLITCAAAGGLLAGRYGGRIAAFGAGILLMLCPLHLWISRTAFAEPTLAFLFLASLLILHDTYKKRAVFLSNYTLIPLAAIMPLVKFEGWLASAVIITVLLARSENRRAFFSQTIFTGAAFLLTLYLVKQGGGSYTLHTLGSILESLRPSVLALFLVFSGLIGAFTLLRAPRLAPGWMPAPQGGATMQAILGRWSWLRFAALAVASFVLVFFIWLRPALFEGDAFYYWPLGRDIKSWREVTLPRLAWYFTLPGLVFGCFGMTLTWLRRNAGPSDLVAAAVFFIALLFLSWDIRNLPLQPYAMRRFIGYVTPLLCIGLVLWPLFVPRLNSSRKQMLQILCVLVLAPVFLHSSRPILVPDERQGIYSKLIRLDRSLSASAPSPIYLSAASEAQRLIIPLHLGFRHPIVPVRRLHHLRHILLSPKDEPQGTEGYCFLLDGSDLAARLMDDFDLHTSSRLSFHERFLWQSAVERPHQVKNRSFDIKLVSSSRQPSPLESVVSAARD